MQKYYRDEGPRVDEGAEPLRVLGRRDAGQERRHAPAVAQQLVGHHLRVKNLFGAPVRGRGAAAAAA